MSEARDKRAASHSRSPFEHRASTAETKKVRSHRAFAFRHALRMHFPGEPLPVSHETMMRIKTVSVRALIATRHLQLHTSAALEPTFCSRHQCTANSASPVTLVDDHARDAPEISGCMKERQDVQADAADHLAAHRCHTYPVTWLVGERLQFFVNQRGRCLLSKLAQQPRDCGAIG
ncbi:MULTISPECIES: hypothetical protein [Burkholderia]|uniref:hypothetical protein n=1 Tax=Burkholderia TaxID=32008 RepID=UPI003B9731FE